VFERINRELRKATAANGGTYVPNPLWSDLMDNHLITVHPLGGCVMGEDAGNGVVNHQGQVFSGTAGSDVYDDLYVCDGAVIPRPLGINPLLTISAIAERTCALLAEQRGWRIDYSLPSSEPRLWVIDLARKQVLHHELVAHGEGSGDTRPVAFSNEEGSHRSSLGLFRTDEAYTGRFGYSLRLSGLESGINDKARARAIVMHGSSDVSRAFAAEWGTIGRSWGCLALPEDVAPRIIDSIAGGSAIFAYYPETRWLRESRYLHCGVPNPGGIGEHLTRARRQAGRRIAAPGRRAEGSRS